MLFAIKPSATACQSGPAGYARPLSRGKRSRQRMSRNGKARVASMTARVSGAPCAARISRQTWCTLTPRIDQRRSAMEIATPTATGSARRAPARVLWSGFGKRQWNEVQQFLEEGLDGLQGGVSAELNRDLVAHRVGALERRVAAIAEGSNRDWSSFHRAAQEGSEGGRGRGLFLDQ